MLKDISSNAIAMLTSDDTDLQRLGLQLIQFNETKEDLLELDRLMNKHNCGAYCLSKTEGYLIENVHIFKPFYKNNDITIIKQRD